MTHQLNAFDSLHTGKGLEVGKSYSPAEILDLLQPIPHPAITPVEIPPRSRIVGMEGRGKNLKIRRAFNHVSGSLPPYREFPPVVRRFSDRKPRDWSKHSSEQYAWSKDRHRIHIRKPRKPESSRQRKPLDPIPSHNWEVEVWRDGRQFVASVLADSAESAVQILRDRFSRKRGKFVKVEFGTVRQADYDPETIRDSVAFRRAVRRAESILAASQIYFKGGNRRFYKPAQGICRGWLSDLEDEIYEQCADVFMTIPERSHYPFAIAMHRAVRHFSRNAGQLSLSDDSIRYIPTYRQNASQYPVEDLQEAANRLPDELRETFRLYSDGFRQHEIAERMDCTQQTVSIRLKNVGEQLASLLK